MKRLAIATICVLAWFIKQCEFAHAAKSPEQKSPMTVKPITFPVVALKSTTKAHLFSDRFEPLKYLNQVPSEVRKFYGASITGRPKDWQQGCVRYAGSKLVEKLFVVGAKSNHLVIVLHKASGYGIFESWDLFEKKNGNFQFVESSNLPLKATLCTSANELIKGVRLRCSKPDSFKYEEAIQHENNDRGEFKVRFGPP